MRKQKGFSLIELLIVVAIILIIAAIAIPNLLRARIAANESSAASSIRTVNTAQVSYLTTYPTQGYSNTMAALGPPAAAGCSGVLPLVTAACLIDWVLASATVATAPKSGYWFADVAFVAVPFTTYVVGGAPATPNTTGVRGFCSNEEGVVRYVASAPGGPVNTSAACIAYTPLN